jgi:hypothetical protein
VSLQPLMAGQLAKELHRQMLAQAEQQRLARQLRALTRASRRARRAERRLRQAVGRPMPLVENPEQ